VRARERETEQCCYSNFLDERTELCIVLLLSKSNAVRFLSLGVFTDRKSL
jgi:hypothetical protein